MVVTDTSNPIKKVTSQLLQYVIKNIAPSPTDNYEDTE